MVLIKKRACNVLSEECVRVSECFKLKKYKVLKCYTFEGFLALEVSPDFPPALDLSPDDCNKRWLLIGIWNRERRKGTLNQVTKYIFKKFYNAVHTPMLNWLKIRHQWQWEMWKNIKLFPQNVHNFKYINSKVSAFIIPKKPNPKIKITKQDTCLYLRTATTRLPTRTSRKGVFPSRTQRRGQTAMRTPTRIEPRTLGRLATTTSTIRPIRRLRQSRLLRWFVMHRCSVGPDCGTTAVGWRGRGGGGRCGTRWCTVGMTVAVCIAVRWVASTGIRAGVGHSGAIVAGGWGANGWAVIAVWGTWRGRVTLHLK